MKFASVAPSVLRKTRPLKSIPATGIGRAQIGAAGHGREIGNQGPGPGQAAVVRDRVTAIDRAAIGKPAFLESGDEKMRVDRRAGDVRLGLRAHVGGERGRIVAEAKIGRDPQIERDRGGFRLD